MSNWLPESVKPERLADTGGTLKGRVPLAEMARLATLVHETDGVVEVVVRSGVDLNGTRFLDIHLRTTLTLVCQRCLDPMSVPVDTRVALGLVNSVQEAEQLMERYEPLVLEEDTLVLRDLIEDELILALPIVALHPASDCAVRVDSARNSGEVELPKRRAFKGLADLIKKHDGED